jgi:hypothetical protein
MAISKQDRDQITALATSFLQEKKVVAIEPIRLFLEQISGQSVDDGDIEECLLHLLRGQRGDIQGVSLDQALLFFPAAIGHWIAGYDVLVIEARLENKDFKAYAFYGIFNQHIKLIGLAEMPRRITTFLSERGIDIQRWFPAENYRQLLGADADAQREWRRVTSLGYRLTSMTQIVLDF